MGEPIEVIVARIDERQIRIERDIKEIKENVKGIHENCAKTRVSFDTRITSVENKQKNSLSGKDKASVIGAILISVTSLLVVLIQAFT